jgi:EpsI family protein
MRSFISVPFVATTVILAGTIVTGSLLSRRVPEVLERSLEEIGSVIDGWTSINEKQLDAGVLKSLTPTSYLARTYQKGESQLDLFIAFYAQQRAGESMHSPKHCLPGSGWEIWRHGSAMIPIDGRQVEVNKYSIQNNGARMLMFYWYQSKSRIIANEYLGKVLLARDTLLTGRSGGSIVRVIVADKEDAGREGLSFVSKLIPDVQRCFGSAPLHQTRLSRSGFD